MPVDFVYRIEQPHRTGMLARVCRAIADGDGLIGDIRTVSIAPDRSIRELSVEVRDVDQAHRLAEILESLDNVHVHEHRPARPRAAGARAGTSPAHGHDHAEHAHRRSLNPGLEGLRFCPRCGEPPTIEFPRSLRCEHCGYAVFYNPKPVAGAIPREPDGRVWLLRRGFDPSAGLWTFPGGFVDLGESVEDAARREAREELEVDLELTGLVGVYSRPQDAVMLVVFDAVARGEPRPTDEAPEVRAFTPADLPWDELAFWSTERALRDVLGDGAP